MDGLLDASCIRRIGLAPYVQHNFTCHQFANRKRCIYNNNNNLHKIEQLTKHFFIIPTDAHNYKITGMFKQLKFPQLLQHVSVHTGTIIRELFHA
jgi:hypothetical protein